ncbi:MAG: calcium-binding protein [Nitratireductor sp.]
MLTISSTPVQINSTSANEEVPFVAMTLASGNVLEVYASLDFAYNGGNGGFSLRATQIDSDGVPVSGTDVELAAIAGFDTGFFPGYIYELPNGNVIMFSDSGDSGQVDYLVFNMNAGANYGDLVTASAITYTPPSGYTLDIVDVDLQGSSQNPDGSINLLVSLQGQQTETSSGNPEQLYSTHELHMSATGVPTDAIDDTTMIFDEKWDAWLELSNGTYATFGSAYYYDPVSAMYVDGLQMKFVDGSQGTTSGLYWSHLIDNGAVPGNPDGQADGVRLIELANGNVLASWYFDSYDDENDGDGIFFTILDPTKESGESIVVPTTAVVTSATPEIEFQYDVIVLSNGTFLFSWNINDTGNFLGGQVFMQHYAANGTPLGGVMELGTAGSQEFFASFEELGNGDVSITWGELTASDTDGFDVMTATFTPEAPVPVSHEVPFLDTTLANGNIAQLYWHLVDDGAGNLTFDQRLRILDDTGTPTGVDELLVAPGLDDHHITQLPDGTIAVFGVDFANSEQQLVLYTFSASGAPLLSNVVITGGVYTVDPGDILLSVNLDLQDVINNGDGTITLIFDQNVETFNGGTTNSAYSIDAAVTGAVSSATFLAPTDFAGYEELSTGNTVIANWDANEAFAVEIRNSGTLLHAFTVAEGAMQDPVSAGGHDFYYTDRENILDIGSGNFLVTWVQVNDDPGQRDGLYFAIGSDNGSVSQTIPVYFSANIGFVAEPVVLSGGGFMLAWAANVSDNGGDDVNSISAAEVWYQQFDANGVPLTAPTQVGTTSSAEFGGAMEVLANGDVLISWGQWDNADADGFDLASITVTPVAAPAPNPVTIQQFVAGDIGDIYDNAILSSDAVSTSPTQVDIQSTVDPNWTASLVGTGFTYDANGFTGGTIDSIDMFYNGQLQASITGLDFDAVYYQTALRLLDGGVSSLHDSLIGNMQFTFFGSAATGAVEFSGGDHSDFVSGSDHADLFNGGGEVDYIYAGLGADTVNGGDGGDWLYGGADGDTINGDDGNDLMFGEAGADIMNGGLGTDYMWGGSEADTMHGNEGADWLRAEEGDDTLYGDAGDDVLIGGYGDDHMYGGIDTDTFYGEWDNDWIYGEANGDVAFGQEGDDHIYGGSEGDFLFGGVGADTINGGTQNDLMWGAMPSTFDGAVDTFEFDANWGFDAVYDFELGVDQVRFNAVAGLTQFSDLTLYDGGANVTVAFGADAITFYGVTEAQLIANSGDILFT